MNPKNILKINFALLVMMTGLIPAPFALAENNESTALTTQTYQMPTTSASQPPQMPSSPASVPGSNMYGFSMATLTPASPTNSPEPNSSPIAAVTLTPSSSITSNATTSSPSPPPLPPDFPLPSPVPSGNRVALDTWIFEHQLEGHEIFSCEPDRGDNCDDFDLGNGDLCPDGIRDDGSCLNPYEIIDTFNDNGDIHYAARPRRAASPSPPPPDEPADDEPSPANSPSLAPVDNPTNDLYPDTWEESPNP